MGLGGECDGGRGKKMTNQSQMSNGIKVQGGK